MRRLFWALMGLLTIVFFVLAFNDVTHWNAAWIVSPLWIPASGLAGQNLLIVTAYGVSRAAKQLRQLYYSVLFRPADVRESTPPAAPDRPTNTVLRPPNFTPHHPARTLRHAPRQSTHTADDDHRTDGTLHRPE